MLYGNMTRITNLWSKVVDGDAGQWFTRVVVESTKPFVYVISENNAGILLECSGAEVNMPEGKLEVNDGLLREMDIKQEGHNTVRVEILLDHPAVFSHTAYNDFPFRLVINLDRSYVSNLLTGKRIVIDPGHGGKDFGGKGPVSLLEKNVVMPIARNLEKLLKRTGAEVTLTRSGDEDVSRKERAAIAVNEDADAYISIHTHASADSSVDGAAVLYAPDNGSEKLALYIQEEIIKKLKVRDRGAAGQPDLAVMDKGIPAVEVEVVTITNIVEEVFLRGLTIQKRAAEGIVNGLIKYFASDRLNAKGDKE